MANGRGDPRKRRDTGRDPGGFVALPWRVLDSAAYMGLSPTAKALLLEVARQFRGDDNGRMLLSRVYMATRGWYSAGVIQQAKTELLAAGLIFQTVMGYRPAKASWYAVTWRKLDKIAGYDSGTEITFEQGVYSKTAAKEKRAAPACTKPKKNASLIPAHGTETALIVPAHGTETPPPVPQHGTIPATFAPLPVPPHGHPLEAPSAGVAPALPSATDSKGSSTAAAKPNRKAGPGRPREPHIEIGGVKVPRVPCAIDRCADPKCNATAGQMHAAGCKHETCPVCASASRHLCRCDGKQKRFLGVAPRRPNAKRDAQATA